jgi:putative ATPase
MPLAERSRPKTLNEFRGQLHLMGEGSVLRRSLEKGNIPSMIFWGPPGVGKTTLASIIAGQLEMPFFTLSAISSGVKDVRTVFEKVEESGLQSVLFIDEIHRFSKAQQDALLGAVEKGLVKLIGATTENPSFEVIPPLLSRCQVYVLKPLDESELMEIASNAIQHDPVLKEKNIRIEEKEALLRLSGGDARKILNAIELVVLASNTNDVVIDNEKVMNAIQKNMALYDKSGEQHYDIISAFIKSMRGSDPNAAVYWLARMVKGGEDPLFIARRMLIFSSEDIGNANPTAMVMANNCFQAVNVIGWPESRIILSQTAIYLANSVKSNSAYLAIEKASEIVQKTGDLPVPLSIRNAPTRLMKNLRYGAGYQYDHAMKDSFAGQEFLPDTISGEKLFQPGNNPRENEMRQFLRLLWKEKYDY